MFNMFNFDNLFLSGFITSLRVAKYDRHDLVFVHCAEVGQQHLLEMSINSKLIEDRVLLYLLDSEKGGVPLVPSIWATETNLEL